MTFIIGSSSIEARAGMAKENSSASYSEMNADLARRHCCFSAVPSVGAEPRQSDPESGMPPGSAAAAAAATFVVSSRRQVRGCGSLVTRGAEGGGWTPLRRGSGADAVARGHHIGEAAPDICGSLCRASMEKISCCCSFLRLCTPSTQVWEAWLSAKLTTSASPVMQAAGLQNTCSVCHNWHERHPRGARRSFAPMMTAQRAVMCDKVIDQITMRD
jgi:hypothetical protein